MRPLTLTLSLALALAAFAAPAAADAPGATAAPAADSQREKWAEHMGNVPFVLGYENGMKEAQFTGKPPMLFFTMEG